MYSRIKQYNTGYHMMKSKEKQVFVKNVNWKSNQFHRMFLQYFKMDKTNLFLTNFFLNFLCKFCKVANFYIAKFHKTRIFLSQNFVQLIKIAKHRRKKLCDMYFAK